MLGFLFALLAGALMAVQGVFNTRVTDASNIWVSNIIVHSTGLLLCVIIWLFIGKPSFMPAINISNKFYLLGGILGALIIFSVVKSISALGPAYAVMLFLSTQLVLAYIIELFGLFGTERVDFEFSKLIGVAIMIVGIIIFKR